jgi:hypothetical protein
MAAPTGQPNWRFCSKCFGLFLNIGDTSADGIAGVCPAGQKHAASEGHGGAHGPTSWDYILIANPAHFPAE